jgi:class 3 adenylate cyclase/WD40 repeat protein
MTATSAAAATTPGASQLRVLVFTDVVRSTDLKVRFGDAVAADLIARHDAILYGALKRTPNATLLQELGDGCYASFASVSDAVNFALRFQYDMFHANWSTPGGGDAALRSRVGIHLGEVIEGPKLSGLAIDVASRVMSVGLGSQILMTGSAHASAGHNVRTHPAVDDGDGAKVLPAVRWMDHGWYEFQGADEPIELFEVGAVGIAPLHAPPGGGKARRVKWRRPGDTPRRRTWRRILLGGAAALTLALLAWAISLLVGRVQTRLHPPLVLAHGEVVSKLFFGGAAEDRVVAIGSSLCRVWDSSGGALLREIPFGDAPTAWSADHHWLYVNWQLVDLATLQIEEKRPPPDDAPDLGPLALKHATAAALSPDGQTVAFSPDGQTVSPPRHLVLLMNVKTREIRQLTGHHNRVGDIAFSPSGALLVCGDNDGRVLVWDVNTGAQVQSLALAKKDAAHEHPVMRAFFGADDHQICSVGWDMQTLVWEKLEPWLGYQLRAQVRGGQQPYAVALSRSGSRLALGYNERDGLVWWDVRGNRAVAQCPGGGYRFMSVAISADGGRVVGGTSRASHEGAPKDEAARVYVWEPEPSNRLTLDYAEPTDLVRAVAITGDGARVAAGGSGKTVRVWNLPK